jgi:hypothetical protein
MKKLKVISILLSALFSAGALAEQGKPPEEKPDFATMKQHIIKQLNAELACAQAATNDTELRACKPKPHKGGHPPPPRE